MRKFTPKSRKQWRDWLAKNHAVAIEVWLVFYKKHTGKPTLSYNDSVEEALCYGWIDGIRKRIDDERYMHRFTPRKPNSNWSETNKKRVARLQKAGLIEPAGTEVIRAAKRTGKWDASARPDIDLSLSAELESALVNDKRAGEFFSSLAPSYQREYIAWIATAKRPETKAKRLSETIRLLKAGKKLGMR